MSRVSALRHPAPRAAALRCLPALVPALVSALVPALAVGCAPSGGAPRTVTVHGHPTATAATTAPTPGATTAPPPAGPGPARTATAGAVPTPPAGSVLAGLARGPAPRVAAIRHALAALVPNAVLGRRIGVLVMDPYTGATLLSRLGTVPLTPASTSKLLTATALVDRYGAGHRFATQVVLQPTTGGPAPPQLVLVGGGDPSLTSAAAAPTGPVAPTDTSVRGPARLPALAAATAAALRTRGVRAVRVTVDDALFTGPRVSPAWPKTDVAEGYVGPVDALTVDNGRLNPFTGRRVADPARAAGARFAALLRADGIAVSGAVVRSAPTAGAAVVATVRSPTVAALVRHMLQDSDNDYAEVLSRQVAVGTDQPATFAGGVTAVDDRLAALGIDLAGLARFDGSGLSHLDRIEPATLAAVVRVDLEHPALGVVLRGAPVAGRKGSLYYRMGGPHGPAAGRIVAKTGTLTRVHDLAGYVIPAGGRPLVFVFMVDTAHDDPAAEDLFDDEAVLLADTGPAA